MCSFPQKKSRFSNLLFFVVLFFVTNQIRAQFPFFQSFKNSTAPAIQFGGAPTAFLTGGAGSKDGYDDPNGSGYLRLTNNKNNQKGYIWSDNYSFPSAYGMTISFEYYAHSGSANGADGIAFILFDATASPVTLGYWGGSLGYAQGNDGTGLGTGFSKGYLGIGIDEYGNFATNTLGKSGGASSSKVPSNITLRGQGSGVNGYDYLTSVQTTALASPFNVAGKDRTATDNTKAGFRKMEIVLKPRSGGGFFIDVYLIHGSVRDLIINNYEYTIAPPPNLKFAISSSTGGSTNFHEIRNLNITIDPATLAIPVATADSFLGCIGLEASIDIISNDNGTVNTLGTINKASVDLNKSIAGIQTSNTVVGKGTFVYDSTTGKVTFIPIDNTVTGPVTINYTFDDTYGKTSNASTITYTSYTPIVDNTISASSPSIFCTSPADPGNIIGSAASGGTATLTYQWESSTDNIIFSAISGATAKDYDPLIISSSTYYRRVVISETCRNISNTVAIIFGKPSTPVATASTAITCNSFVANWNLVSNATSYGLEVATDSGFTNHVGTFDGRDLTTSASYTVTGLVSGTTYYYRVWAFNSCGTSVVSSNEISVIVGSGSVAGIVSSPQTICSGSSPADLTLSGHTGTIEWQSSTDNITFNTISGAISSTLSTSQMGVVTVDTYYRAAVSSGICPATNSPSVLIKVNPKPTLTGVAQVTTVCAGSEARINLTGLLANSASTVEYSIDGVPQVAVTDVVADNSGAAGFNSAVLTAANNGEILEITGITTTSATPNCSKEFAQKITLRVDPSTVGGTVTLAQTICSGTSPANLTLRGHTGTVLRWQKSNNAAFSSSTDITSTSTTLSIGNLSVNTYFRAVVQSGGCSAAFSAPVLITVTPRPAAPVAACYETATFNITTCSWDLTGTKPAEPAKVNCWDNFVFDATSCTWKNIGTQATEPAKVNCWDNFVFDAISCTWENKGNQPAEPTKVNCWDNFVFDTISCTWKNTGTQATEPAKVNCWDNFVFDATSCTWKNIGTQATEPTKVNCWDDFVFNRNSCTWENKGSQPAEPAKVNCWDNFVFDAISCTWENTGSQPAEPTKVNCWDNFVFDAISCTWENTGSQPAEPTKVNCWDDFVFNRNSCTWENKGIQPAELTKVNCWDNFVFNTISCTWENKGNQPAEPTKVNCWDNFVFDAISCTWENTGSQPAEPTKVNCWDDFVFNRNSCTWENKGIQPAEPTKVNCWDDFVFNRNSCTWENKGIQATEPAKVNCWDNFVFNTSSCTWENTGTKPAEPTKVNCWDNFVFNTSSCTWENTGTKPAEPAKVNCWDNFVFNTISCAWENTGKQVLVPMASVTAQPTCDVATGTIKVRSSTVGLSFSIDGLDYTNTSGIFMGLKPGKYTITAKNAGGCVSLASANLIVDGIECIRPLIKLTGTAVFNDSNGDGYAQPGETIIYNFVVTNTGNVPLTNITISDLLPGIIISGGPISLGIGESDGISFIGTYTITQGNISLGRVSNQAVVSGISPDGIVVEDRLDFSVNLNDYQEVLSVKTCEVKVFNAMTPNGDDKNGIFYIEGLECYPDNKVEIYNRWGILVFETEHYNNEDKVFRGVSEGRMTTKESDGLPAGTYYYILRYRDETSAMNQKAGYLYIAR